MNARVAYKLEDLEQREILTKVKNAHDAVLNNGGTFATPNPPLAEVIGAHDDVRDKLDVIDAAEQTLEQMRVERDELMAVMLAKYRTLGAYVETTAAGDPAIILMGGYDVVQPRGPVPSMPKVENNAVTAGDNDGEADATWDSVRGAKSYEVQTAANPSGPWAHEETVTKSRVHLSGKPSGQKLWTRVRAVNALGPGAWSDPACCTVP